MLTIKADVDTAVAHLITGAAVERSAKSKNP